MLTALNDMKYNQFVINKTLVIAPKKVAEATWSNEAAKWDHLSKLRVVSVLGSIKKRVRALNTPGDIYVMSRDSVQWIVEYYRNQWPFQTVVIDELTSFKSHKAKRFKALTWVRKYITRIYGLTGTPAPNGLLDLWAQLYLLDEGKRLGKGVEQFRDQYFEPDSRDQHTVFSYRLKAGAEEQIHRLIGDICVSMKAEDYITLPECISVITPVVLDAKAKAAYEELEKHLYLEIGDDVIDAGSAAILTNKLLQLCNGAVYDQDRQVVEIHRCKIEAFLELVEGLNGHSAIVFYNFQHDKIRIKEALSDFKINGMKIRVRDLKTPQDQLDWNAGLIDILLAHPASAAYGLNLQDGGNHIIWFGLNWSAELYLQANKRLHRQGQKQTVILHHLVVEGGRDSDVMAALEGKIDVQNCLMESLKARINKVTGKSLKTIIQDVRQGLS